MKDQQTAERRFRHLYEKHYAALLAYALRRCSDPSEASDAVADAFLVLWRRLPEAPTTDDEVLLWLYGVMKRVLANRERSRWRRRRLAERLSLLSREALEEEQSEARRADVLNLMNALAELTEQDREIILLAAWEGLSNVEIGKVLGCSENAATIRLHRARKRLTEVYEKDSTGTGDSPDERLRLRQPREERQEG
jgi:RNA polymerase sigma factor (sigma-70 family)